MIGSQYLRTHLQWNRWCAKCCLYRIMELSRGRALIWWVLVWNRIPSEVALPALPPLCPSDCTGNVTTRRFSMFGIETKQNYVWAIRNPQRTKCRCTLPEVAINCWESCCTSCTGDAGRYTHFWSPRARWSQTWLCVGSKHKLNVQVLVEDNFDHVLWDLCNGGVIRRTKLNPKQGAITRTVK